MPTFASLRSAASKMVKALSGTSAASAVPSPRTAAGLKVDADALKAVLASVREKQKVGALREALQVLEDRSGEFGQVDEFALLKGDVLLASGDGDGAIAVFAALCAETPPAKAAFIRLARAHKKNGALGEAEKAVGAGLGAFPGDRTLVAEQQALVLERVLEEADARIAEEDYAGAQAALASAADTFRDALRFVLKLSEVRALSNDYDGAVAVLEEAIARGLDSKTIYIRLGHLHHDRRDGAASLNALKDGLQRHPDDSRLLMELALRHHSLLDLANADATWNLLFEKHPQDAVSLRAGIAHLIRRRQFARAAEIARKAAEAGVDHPDFCGVLVQAVLRSSGPREAEAILQGIVARGGRALADQWAYAQVLDADRKTEAALAHIDTYLDRHPEDARSDTIQALRANLEARINTARIINSVPLAAPVQGVAVMLTGFSSLAFLYFGLAVTELRKSGFAAVTVEAPGHVDIDNGGLSDVDYFSGLITADGHSFRDQESRPKRTRQWRIDFANRVIEAEGINVFQPIYERISTVMRRYTVDFDHPIAREVMNDALAQADIALDICKELHEKLGNKGYKIRVLGGMSHYIPSAVYKLYSRIHRHEVDFEYVAFKSAYQHYYSDFKNKESTALSINSLTRYPNMRMPNFAVPEWFDRWCANLPAPQDQIAFAKKVMGYDRARQVVTDDAKAALDRIVAHHDAGKRVYCLFGKLTYDIAVENEGGAAHVDMLDWIRHTIATVAKDPDILLIIKPHPNELRREIVIPSEYFAELVGTDLPDNVILLHNRWLNMSDIVGHLSLGIIWHGTSALELTASGIPALVASRTGNLDHPITFWNPKDRAHYEELLLQSTDFSVPPDLQERAALLIAYYGSDEIMIPYDYGNMAFLRRLKVGPAAWYMDKVEKYLAEGDPYVTEIARRII